MNKKIAILIPAYNEEKKIRKTLEEIMCYAKDVVVVDDGSTDQTLSIVSQYSVTLIKNDQNMGIAKTVARGLAYLIQQDYDYVITMDADGQMNAPYLPVFYSAIQENSDIDILCATYNPDTPLGVRKDMIIFSALYRLATGVQTKDFISCYRAHSRRAMEFLIRHPGDRGRASSLLLLDMHRAGLKSVELDGGVSYSQQEYRPFPLGAQFQCRRLFIQKMFVFPGIRSKLISLFAIPFLLGMMVYNLIFLSRYNSIHLKR